MRYQLMDLQDLTLLIFVFLGGVRRGEISLKILLLEHKAEIQFKYLASLQKTKGNREKEKSPLLGQEVAQATPFLGWH